jgi:hypothetical protein
LERDSRHPLPRTSERFLATADDPQVWRDRASTERVDHSNRVVLIDPSSTHPENRVPCLRARPLQRASYDSPQIAKESYRTSRVRWTFSESRGHVRRRQVRSSCDCRRDRVTAIPQLRATTGLTASIADADAVRLAMSPPRGCSVDTLTARMTTSAEEAAVVLAAEIWMRAVKVVAEAEWSCEDDQPFEAAEFDLCKAVLAWRQVWCQN